MKKHLLTVIFMVLAFAKAYPQQTDKPISQITDPKEIVQEFFEKFHEQDTTSLKTMFLPEAQLHSLLKRGNQLKPSHDNINSFLKGIASIPETVKFEEQLGELQVLKTVNTATVSMPYTFMVNGQKSHSGTNIFVMLRTREGWKISSIADSRVYN
ncbi:hypothetical protein BST97_05975 [Nonlabens spongiae]|uniref:DUF4440 domain-containing protein n=1 Tax=Nonlabens spongiae TaxID=331648 RepID=A0A1W6MJ11_9FLAO|nr:hypothetical protein [Nonlabens spongiae]ARN77573.1 hypothetical protein BST97_05975 [Nonlabens spongiae]